MLTGGKTFGICKDFNSTYQRMKSKKDKQTGLSNADRIMFDAFMEWVNLKKGIGTFWFKDPDFQSFKDNNGILLDFESPIPDRLNKPNAIFYHKKGSAVFDLGRHIRNAYSHSRIRKAKDFFIMYDLNPATNEVTMRGKVSVNLMPELLNAIRNNKRDRSKGQSNVEKRTI